MARSSPPPEDAIRASGLRPGTICRLEFESGGRQRAISTVLQEIESERLVLLVSAEAPVTATLTVSLPRGRTVWVSFAGAAGRCFRFTTTSLDPGRDGRLLALRLLATISPGDRRGAFRLDMALRPVEIFRLVVDPDREPPARLARTTTVIDISEGGVCLSTRASITAGERLGLRVELPGSGLVSTRLIVRSCEEPPAGMRNRRLHCEFIDIDTATRETLVRFVLRRQRELRAWGQR